MGKVWDIIPPPRRPRKYKRLAQKKSSKKAVFFFGLLVIIFLGAFLYEATKNPFSNVDSVSNSIVTSSPQETPASPEVAISPTAKTKGNLILKLINGSGHSEEKTNVEALLIKNGFKIAKTENALNLYEQTIVYYQAPQEKYAKDIATILERYQAKIQKFSQETTYDIIIVIGGR